MLCYWWWLLLLVVVVAVLLVVVAVLLVVVAVLLVVVAVLLVVHEAPRALCNLQIHHGRLGPSPATYREENLRYCKRKPQYPPSTGRSRPS